MFDVMAGPEPARLTGRAPVDAGVPVDLRGARVALIDSMSEIDVDPDVAANLHTAARHLESAGALVEPIPFPWSYGRLFTAAKMVFAQYYGPMVRWALDDGGDLTDYARAFSASMDGLTGDYRINLQARAETAELQRAFAEMFARFDYLLLPTLAAPAYPAGDHFVDRGPIVEGREQPDRWIVAFTIGFNLVSACPVVSLPTGLSRHGIPTAAQIVARPYHDHSAISVAEQLEHLFGR
jgi:amidase/aspartyl-tRNA(Asn)/glutamyl-tRNA(Gln) amidotransferase subunit A